MKLYRWQQECLQAWNTACFRGIAHVVTGAGKTFLALNAMDLYLARCPDARIRKTPLSGPDSGAAVSIVRRIPV